MDKHFLHIKDLRKEDILDLIELAKKSENPNSAIKKISSISTTNPSR